MDLDKIDADDDKVIAGTGAKQGVTGAGCRRLARRRPPGHGKRGRLPGRQPRLHHLRRGREGPLGLGNQLEHLAMRYGHYPVKRAKAKGSSRKVSSRHLRLGSPDLRQRGARQLRRRIRGQGRGQSARYLQFLPTGVAPEGSIAIRPATCSWSRTRRTARTTCPSHDQHLSARCRAPLSDGRLGRRSGDGGADRLGRAFGTGSRPGAVGTVYAVSDSYYGTPDLHARRLHEPRPHHGLRRLKQDGQPVAYDLEGIALKAAAGSGGGLRGQSRQREPADDGEPSPCRWPRTGRSRKSIPLPKELADQADPLQLRGRGHLGPGCCADR